MNFRTRYVIFALSLIACTQLFGRGSLIKQHSITLPCTPSVFKFNSTETHLSLIRQSLGFYCSGLLDENKNNILQQYALNSNPKTMHITPHTPLITEFSVINKAQESCNNPLYDTELKYASLSWMVPVIVTHKEPNKIYLVESMISTTQQNLLASEPVCDAQGQPSAGIIGLSLGSTSTVEHSILNEYVFAAVKGSDGVWGTQNSSGIAVIYHARNRKEIVSVDENGKEKKEIKVDRFLQTIDATTGEVGGNKAVALDAAAISINGGAYSLNAEAVDLFWHPIIERLYVALQVKNSSECSSTQGSRALLVGRIDTQQRLIFDPIVPDDLCQGIDKIVGATGPDVATSLHKVRTLATSTGYTYLIIVGGVGEPHETDRDVYALPLTNGNGSDASYNRASVMSDPNYGVIASKNCGAQLRYGITLRGPKVVSRTLQDKNSHSDDCFTKYDKEVVVGAGKTLPGPITDIITLTDVVYVTCAQAGEGQQPGIFHSQALVCADGKIAAWTPWQRVAGIQEGVAQAMITPDNYFIAYLKAHSPEIVCNITADSKANNDTQSDCAELLNKVFIKEEGGVYGLVDISASSPLCGNAMNVAFLIATGYKKVAFVETGVRTQEGIFTAFKESYTENVITMHEGTLKPFEYTNDACPCSVIVEGGALDDVGAVTDVVVVGDCQQSWVVLSGKGGIAILAADDGSGIPNDPGILPHFAGITIPYSFKKIGVHTGIRKLWADEHFLYVLTQRTLERFEITQDFIMNPRLQKGTILAQLAGNEGSLFDVGVSGPLCILAGSKGLFVNAPGTDCRKSEEVLSWNKIELPYAKGNVYKLFFVSSTDQKNGFGHGGQVYVSTGSLVENMSRIYRLYIDDVFKSGVVSESVKLVLDIMYTKYGTYPLLTFNNFRDHFATDGVHYFSARSRQTRDNPFVKLVSLPLLNEVRASDPNSYDIPIHMGKKCAKISAIVQNSATGNWLFAGDFGLALHN